MRLIYIIFSGVFTARTIISMLAGETTLDFFIIALLFYVLYKIADKPSYVCPHGVRPLTKEAEKAMKE